MTLPMRHGEWEESKERESERGRTSAGEMRRFHPTVKQISRQVSHETKYESRLMK